MSDERLKQPLTVLKGIGDRSAALFAKCGAETVGDLLHYYPRSYDLYEETVTVSALTEGRIAAVLLTVVGKPSLRRVRSLSILSVRCADETGEVSVSYFNAPYLVKAIKPMGRYVFRGRVRRKGNRFTIDQPAMFKEEEYASLVHTMQPRYPLTKGLTNRAVMKAVERAFKEAAPIEETLPADIISAEGFVSHSKALIDIHFPRDTESFLAARRRLSFGEFYTFIRQLRALKEETEETVNGFPCIEVADCSRLIEALPYRLTNAQLRVWEEIKNDLAGPHTMQRLIQGDVGSGKTILAFLALLMCAANGYQGAIMAPTSVLAAQHYNTFLSMIEKYRLPLKPVLLTGSLSAKDKREAQREIAEGEVNLIVGTHALIQEKVGYKNLALVITDEQHRFGVRQREVLAEKSGNAPHILAMSATPIPRSLAIILYGDLHISLLDEQPAERVRIKNAVIPSSDRDKAWRFVLKQVKEGRQAYMICPMIEPGEMDGVENVTEYEASLTEAFPPDIRTGILHGKMKPKDKDRIMEEFSAGNLDILVSTTVIEVGVNVPNATVMLIEDAQRFGLAQLHQLRGRVGRGAEQSYCILVDSSGEGDNERLSILQHSTDGFHIAEEDLRLRGPGDLFGIRQSGALSFRIADVYRDADLLKKAAYYADF